MNDFRLPDSELSIYRVQLGHLCVSVQSDSPAEAIAHARRQLCHELPRMWDAIQLRPDADFTVVPATPEAVCSPKS